MSIKCIIHSINDVKKEKETRLCRRRGIYIRCIFLLLYTKVGGGRGLIYMRNRESMLCVKSYMTILPRLEQHIIRP
jgi:hypothetical protein